MLQNPTARCLVVLACLSQGLAAQSTISPVDRYAYAANTGWVDFRPSAVDGVRVTETYFSGKAYAANFGWIDLGDGSPDNGYAYSNGSATDCGVNLAADGSLTGYAYAANVGWINFEQVHGQPKLNFLTGKFTGSIYSANLGWISLDTSFTDLLASTIAYPDTDNDGIADAWEKKYFGSLGVVSGTTDFDHDGQSDLAEYQADTVPNDPYSLFRIISQSLNSDLTKNSLVFTTSPSRLYRVEHDTGLGGPWADSEYGTFAPDAGASTSRTLHFAASSSRFFRAVAIRPLQ
jgi:hypothetical protein